MAYFKFAYDLTGQTEVKKPFYIVTNTAIEKGEIVKFTPGTGIQAVSGTDFDAPSMGVAVEAHDGSTAGRQKGTEIFVSCSPTAVFALKDTFVLTATGGSTTTFVDSTLLPQTNSLWKGSYLEVVTCAANADLVGKMIKITDSTGATGTLTFGAVTGGFAAGDTAVLHPGPLAIGEYGWDLDANGTSVDYTTSGGEGLQLVDVDAENRLSFWKFRQHQFSSYPAVFST